jgi:nucleoside-diphosphate-sugar epimerase
MHDRSRDRSRVFLAGATGVIGHHLIPLLLNAGYDVIGTTRSAAKAAGLRSLGVQAAVVDALDRPRLFAAVGDAKPDLVIHALTDLAESDFAGNARLRIEGTRNLVDAARAAGVRRIVAESIAFAYAPGDGPAREDDPLDIDAPEPRRATALAVHALEQTAAEMPECTILRFGILYGPGTWYEADGTTADRVRAGTMRADGSVTSFLHVEDAAIATLHALMWPTGVFNVVDDEPAPASIWLPIFATLVGAPAPLVALGADRSARGASNAKACGEQGWIPRYPSWREGFPSALAGSLSITPYAANCALRCPASAR